jgi:drug/metabolite transporter (DMT)-like permease
LGALVSLVGVGLTVFLQPALNTRQMGLEFQLSQGELLAIGGAVAIAIAGVLTKLSLQSLPLGLFSIIRTLAGTVIFAVIVFGLFGPEHFADVFSPFVWRWIAVYGAVVIVAGQLFWFQGLKRTTVAEASLANSISPVAGIAAAYLILGEIPTLAQVIGGSVILAGVVLTQYGIWHQTRKPKWTPGSEPSFKGV